MIESHNPMDVIFLKLDLILDASQADIRPQTDGCNGLRYNLTADIIESIFRTYPAGKQEKLIFDVRSNCRLSKALFSIFF